MSPPPPAAALQAQPLQAGQPGPRFQPHDLVCVSAGQEFPHAPQWVAAALARAPFVVVRRAAGSAGRVAVGVRGATRARRFGAWLEPSAAGDIVRPEQLAGRAPAGARAGLAAFALLAEAAPCCNAFGLAWGPVGSAGFELASGVPSVTPESDLDLLVRAPEPLAAPRAVALLAALSACARRAGARADVQVETPHGAFLLAERCRPGSAGGAPGSATVLLRTPGGPYLVSDPWRLR